MTPKSMLLTIFVLLTWGFGTAITKVAVLETSALIFLMVRSICAVIVFLPFAKVDKKELKNLFFLGVSMYVLHMGFVSASLRYLPVSSASVIQQVQVPFALVLGWLFFKEKITRWQVIGSIIAFTGVCVIFGIPHLDFLGTILMMLGGFFWAVAQIFMKRAAGVKPVALVAYMSLFSLPFLMVGAFVIDGNVIEKIKHADVVNFWLVLLFQLVFTNLALVLWQQLVAQNGVNKMSPFMFLQIVFTIFSGVVLYHEQITIHVIVGAMVAAFGVYLTTRKRKTFPIDVV